MDGHIITLYIVAVHDNIVTCAVSPCTQSPDTHDDESRLCLSIVTQILLNLGDLSIKFQCSAEYSTKSLFVVEF